MNVTKIYSLLEHGCAPDAPSSPSNLGFPLFPAQLCCSELWYGLQEEGQGLATVKVQANTYFLRGMAEGDKLAYWFQRADIGSINNTSFGFIR